MEDFEVVMYAMNIAKIFLAIALAVVLPSYLGVQSASAQSCFEDGNGNSDNDCDIIDVCGATQYPYFLCIKTECWGAACPWVFNEDDFRCYIAGCILSWVTTATIVTTVATGVSSLKKISWARRYWSGSAGMSVTANR